MRLPKPLSERHAGLRFTVLVAAFGFASIAQTSEAKNSQLDESEIRETLVGHKFKVRNVEGSATARLEPNGVARAKGDDWKATGHWIVFDDRLCFYLVGGAVQRNTCAAIEEVAPGLFWAESGTLLEIVPD